MARTEARFFASTWTDDADWRALHPDGKLLYQFLLAQPELRHCGVIQVSLKLWARRIGWDVDQVMVAVKYARDARYVVVDDDTEELLVRTLIRNDGIWKQPKMLAVAITDAARVESATLRAAILRELRRLDPNTLPDKTRGSVAAVLRDLPERIANAHGEGPADPPPHAPRLVPPEGHGDAPSDPRAEAPAEGGAQAHAQGVRGKGNGYGRTVKGPLAPVPLPLAPSPRHGAAWRQAPIVTPVAGDAQTGEEGESGQAGNPTEADLGTLVAAVRKTRPDWSSRSIGRALTEPSVLERGWDRVQRAMLAVAADPQSKHPGRLAADGDWWCQGTPAAGPPPRPPWCGDPDCDPATRMRGMHSDQPSRCTECGGGTPARRAS